LKIAPASAARFLEKPDPGARAVLLYGPNANFVSEAAATLVRKALGGADDPYALTRLTEDDMKRDRVRLGDALAAQSLLGGPSVVWARVDGKGADEAILDALGAIERGAPCAYFVIEGGDLGGASALVKAFGAAARAAAIAFYEETQADRAAFARARIKELGLGLESDAADALMAALPADRGLARGELEKLALYAHGLGRDLSSQDVQELLPGEADGELNAATLAAASGKPDRAVEALARIEALSGVSALRALLRRMQHLAEARAHMDEGASAAEAVAKLRPPVFFKERDTVIDQARAWSAKKLNAAFDILWAAELRAKRAGAPQDLIAADAFRSVAKLVAPH